ncbi:DUF669 domain-containing protein [Lentilactobacillus hilgardii]|uniref:DUF669 domain-containing protein n=1 Tax=Lentilactobacillus hilgardii TaxID=1588 RepID=UPI0021A7B560|nr:DUF669 domain-containing protein [Lentilactobacillus hilgardii]MCT3390351.1 DUF669 domain-containing protein [Lentilactobacillus hilgardii]
MTVLFTVDSNNVFGTTIQEAGRYNVRVTDVQNTKSKGRGLPMLVVTFEVTDGKYKGGQIRYHNMVWDNEDQEHLKTSVKRFNTFLVALGVRDGSTVESLDQIAQAARGNELSVDTQWGQPNNNGQVYLEVRTYHRKNPDGSQPNGVKRPNAGQPSTTTNSNSNSNPFPKTNNDPFAKSNDTIDVTDNQLPF